MGLPNILISFKNKASTAIKRGDRGIVAVIVIDTPVGVTNLDDITMVPGTLTADNKAYVERAFLGGQNAVKKVVLIVTDTIANGLNVLETQKFDYAVGPHDISAPDVATMATFVKGLRDNKGIKVKAVLPSSASDHEGIINFVSSGIEVGVDTFSAAEYCSRIAGLLAGTPLQMSATYFSLPEVEDVPKFTKAELDAKVDLGQFVIFHDGEKVKVARAVNSLVTVGTTKSADYKSIKIVDIMDLIYSDVKRTCEDNYIGKFPNTYDNKVALIVSIQAYLEALRAEQLLDQSIVTSIDLIAQKLYLNSNGVDTSNMSDQEIKEANTQTKVFISSKYKILNAIEDISVEFFI